MNISILDDYQNCVRHLNCFAALAEQNVQIFNDNAKDIPSLASRLANAEALVLTRERTQVSAALLDLLPNLKLIVQTAKLGAHVDLSACTERGIAVADGQGDGNAAAELTWALIMASRRYLVAEVNRLRDGLWQGHLGQQLRGQRLGIWSYGRIGQRLAQYGKAFGMHVWVWGSEASTRKALEDGFQAAPSKAAFFADSDVISLHIRLLKATTGLVTAADLTLMKPTALFVNTSRAELVQPDALEHALQQGRPGFAAVDVFEEEPILGARHPLLRLPNALCTPHIGFVERDTYELYYGTAFDQIVGYSTGQPINLVNPEVLTHPRQNNASQLL